MENKNEVPEQTTQYEELAGHSNWETQGPPKMMRKSKVCTKPKSNAKVNNVQVPAKVDTYDLRGVVNLLLLLGVTTVDLWEKLLFELRTKVSDIMNAELTTLYFNLKMVSNGICTGVAQNSDLSQHKLDRINNTERGYDEIMSYADPVIKVFTKNLFSVETVKIFKELVQDIIVKINSIEISDDEGTREMQGKRKSMSSDDSDDGEEDDGVDVLFRKFSRKTGSQKKVISQQITSRSEDTIRKCVTPGETGKYLMKIEITDCDDLKGVKPQQYWTKVWKKAVFLVNDDKDTAFTTLNSLWAVQAKRVLQIKNAKVTEFEENDEKDSRKRARFFR